MEDLTDDRPIRIRYFAAFVLKSTKTKERVGKFKEVYRDYNKYKDILTSYGYDTNTLARYQQAVKFIGINRITLIDEIYKKGSVVIEDQQQLKPLIENTVQ